MQEGTSKCLKTSIMIIILFQFGVAFLSYDKEGKEKGRPMTMSDINKDTSLGQSKWNLVISGTVSSDGKFIYTS